jgi:hypothetical protein
MCIYTFYRFNCGHEASLREDPEWNRFLTEPCANWSEEGEDCQFSSDHCIYLQIICWDCGGPADPRSGSFELEESNNLIWYIQEFEVQEVFQDIDWAGPETDGQEAPSVSPKL